VSGAAGYDATMNDDRSDSNDRDDDVPAHHDGVIAADATDMVAQQELLTLVTENEPALTAENER